MNDVYKYICCGENSDAIEESTIKPIDESKIQFYTFNSQGKYKPLPRLEADKREEMKRLYFSNKVNGWTIAPPQPVMLYDSNKNKISSETLIEVISISSISFDKTSNQFFSFLGNAMSIDIVPPILSSFIAEYLPKALAAVNLCNIAFLPSFSVHSKKSPSFLLKN